MPVPLRWDYGARVQACFDCFYRDTLQLHTYSTHGRSDGQESKVRVNCQDAKIPRRNPAFLHREIRSQYSLKPDRLLKYINHNYHCYGYPRYLLSYFYLAAYDEYVVWKCSIIFPNTWFDSNPSFSEE